MSFYSDHNKRKRLSREDISYQSGSPHSDYDYDGDGANNNNNNNTSADDQFDEYYRSPAHGIINPSSAASHHSHHSNHSYASHGSGRRAVAAAADRGQHAPTFRDGESTIATINSADLISLKRDREREGRCAECGAQTHELRVDPVTGTRTKEPLNVDGEVRRGRCLYCYPLPSHVHVQQQQQQQQHQQSQAHHNSQSSFGSHPLYGHSTSHRSIGSHRITPDEALSHVSFNSAPVTSAAVTSHRSFRGGTRSSGGGVGRLVSGSAQFSSRSMGSADRFIAAAAGSGGGGGAAGAGGAASMSMGDMSPRRGGGGAGATAAATASTLSGRLNDLPDTIESNSVASGGLGSIASTTSAAQLAADQLAIEEALTRLETENADLTDILAAMRRFPRCVRLQEMGCEKLWIQSWDDENSSAIGRVGGIPTIIDAMRTHAESSHLQQCGCEALQNLALNDYNREVIAEQGGIIAVIDAMGRHWDVAGVQQCGCTALANIAGGDEGGDNRVAVGDCGGLHAILKAVQSFPEDETVLRSAYQALRSLGYNPTQELERAQQEQDLADDEGDGGEAEVVGDEDMSDEGDGE